MLKKIACLFFTVLCAYLGAQSSSIRLGVLKGVSCTPGAYLIENKDKLAVQNISFQIFDSAQSELPKLLRNQLDIGFLTPENAAKVYEKTSGSIIVLGVVQNGNMSLLTNEESYASLEDLKDKKIICSGVDEGEPLIFKHLLSKKGIDVQLDYSIPKSKIGNSLFLKTESFGLLEEPYTSAAIINSTDTHRMSTVQKIYNESEGGSTYPVLLLVARTDFVKQNRELVRKFIDVYKNALNWTIKNPAKAALLSEKHKISTNSAVIKQAIPASALLWRDAGAAKGDIEKYLNILIEEKSPAVSSTLPSEDFYF